MLEPPKCMGTLHESIGVVLASFKNRKGVEHKAMKLLCITNRQKPTTRRAKARKEKKKEQLLQAGMSTSRKTNCMHVHVHTKWVQRLLKCVSTSRERMVKNGQPGLTGADS